MASPCAKHPHHPLVGVCASCLSERLATCMGSLGNNEAASTNNEAFGSSIILSQGLVGNGSPILRESDKRTLSYYLESIHGVSSTCNVHASHRKTISSDALYQGSSFYTAHHYVAAQGLQGGAKEYPSLTKEKPPPRPLSWLSAFFSKREEKQKADSGECSIAPWRECSKQHEEPYHHSFSSDAPSWEQLSPWPKRPTSSPLKLSSLPSSQSTRSPLKLPPLLRSAHSTRSPSMPLTSRSTRSPLKLTPLRSSPRTPLKLPPLLSYPKSPLKLFTSKATDGSAQEEADQRSGGHGVPSKRREIWFGILMRNKWVVRFKRHFAKKKKQEEVESVRTSSARESDFCRHSQNHYLVQARQGQNHWLMERNQRSPMQSRACRGGGREGEAQRWGSASGRDYAGWDSYFSSSFNGLQVRHRYHSADSAELLRFYLTPVRSTCKLRSHHYYY